jgi:hypothetical protein
MRKKELENRPPIFYLLMPKQIKIFIEKEVSGCKKLLFSSAEISDTVPHCFFCYRQLATGMLGITIIISSPYLFTRTPLGMYVRIPYSDRLVHEKHFQKVKLNASWHSVLVNIGF